MSAMLTIDNKSHTFSFFHPSCFHLLAGTQVLDIQYSEPPGWPPRAHLGCSFGMQGQKGGAGSEKEGVDFPRGLSSAVASQVARKADQPPNAPTLLPSNPMVSSRSLVGHPRIRHVPVKPTPRKNSGSCADQFIVILVN